MPRRIFTFDPPDRFVAGTVGVPGQRTFFLQARDGARVLSVVLEKVQVAALAEKVVELLAEARGAGADVQVDPERVAEDEGPLDEPLVEAFRVGTMGLAWDGGAEQVVIEARAASDDEEADADDDDEVDLLRVRLPPSAALGFAVRALRIVASGRPPCPICGLPLNPEGHICPRRNGLLN